LRQPFTDGANQKPIRRFGFQIRFLNQISDFGKSSETAVPGLDFQPASICIQYN
jgi:hypothetical protein